MSRFPSQDCGINQNANDNIQLNASMTRYGYFN